MHKAFMSLVDFTVMLRHNRLDHRTQQTTRHIIVQNKHLCSSKALLANPELEVSFFLALPSQGTKPVSSFFFLPLLLSHTCRTPSPPCPQTLTKLLFLSHKSTLSSSLEYQKHISKSLKGLTPGLLSVMIYFTYQFG